MEFNKDEDKKEEAPLMQGSVKPSFKKISGFKKSTAFSKTAGGFKERLKRLSKRDMAFVLIGVAILLMAPVAEYLISKPSATDGSGPNKLEKGFGGREIYEPGAGGFSEGSPDGSGEVITPLTFRDPTSLIVGAQSAQPPAPPVSTYTPPKDYGKDFRDAAKNSFAAVTKAPPTPTVIPKMQSALRGFSSFAGGGEGTRTNASLGGNRILDSARNASSKAAQRSLVGPVASAGYRGVSNSPNSASRGAFEKLRAQGNKAAGNFSGSGAAGALDRAAHDSVNVGGGSGSGGMGGGSGEKDKSNGGNSTRDTKSFSGETLEQMAAKQRMQKALDWEFYKQYEIPKQLINAALSGVTGQITKAIDGVMESMLGTGPAPGKKCWVPVNCGQDMLYCSKYLRENYPNQTKVSFLCSAEGEGAVALGVTGGKDSAKSEGMFCVCGYGATPNGNVAGTKPTGNTPPGSTTTAGGNIAPAKKPFVLDKKITDVFAKYDEKMDLATQSIAEVLKSDDEKKVGAAVASAAGQVALLDVTGIKNSVNNYKNEAQAKLTAYQPKYSSAESEITAEKTAYSVWSLKFKVVADAAAAGTLKPKAKTGNLTGEATGINEYVASENAKLDVLTKQADVAADRLIKHKLASVAYAKQLEAASAAALNIHNYYSSTILGFANEAQAKLKEPTNSAEYKKELENQTIAMLGSKLPNIAKEEQIIEVGKDGSTTDVPLTSSLPIARQEKKDGWMKTVLDWRGVDYDMPYYVGKPQDSSAVQQEVAVWAKLDPYVAEKPEDSAPGSLLSALMRVVTEIPAAIDTLSADIETLSKPAIDRSAEAAAIMAGLAARGVDINNPALSNEPRPKSGVDEKGKPTRNTDKKNAAGKVKSTNPTKAKPAKK